VAKIIHPGDAARYCRRCHRVSERAGTFADVRSYAASGGQATSTVVIHAAGIYEYTA